MNKPMESKQQTALEWYIEQVDKLEEEDGYPDIDKLFWLKEDALAMEREQIETAYIVGIIHPLEMEASKQAKQYFNDTYGTESSR